MEPLYYLLVAASSLGVVLGISIILSAIATYYGHPEDLFIDTPNAPAYCTDCGTVTTTMWMEWDGDTYRCGHCAMGITR